MDFKRFSELILIEQTLFTLPFAYLGLLFAGGGTFKTWILVTIALAAARTSGMSFNRVIDAKIDKKNPRTKDRVLPRGDASPVTVWLIAVISAFVLIVASYMINTLCFYLSFVAVFLLFTYLTEEVCIIIPFLPGGFRAAAPLGSILCSRHICIYPVSPGICLMARMRCFIHLLYTGSGF
jgi:4-hydroxybenzoate polyprenyltransferase